RQHSCRSIANLRTPKAAIGSAAPVTAPRCSREPLNSDFSSLCEGNRVVDIDAEISNSVFDV
ncbi:MAG: hypothetical protein ACRCY3_14615, partial [Sphingorhabdus sp.]